MHSVILQQAGHVHTFSFAVLAGAITLKLVLIQCQCSSSVLLTMNWQDAHGFQTILTDHVTECSESV